jgi:hypothetical protein
MNRLPWACALVLTLLWRPSPAQVIPFESNGLRYQALTRAGVTVMYATMNFHLRGYTIIQAAISNGSTNGYLIRPEDFVFVRPDGSELRASTARSVINLLAEKGGGNDVIKLVTAYEAAVYGNMNMRSTNGYEQRRQAALAGTGGRLRAAATASAIALVQNRLPPGQSTDGAVFFPTDGKPLGPGQIVVRTTADVFEFLPGS